MAEVSRRAAQGLAPLFVAVSVLLLALLAFNLRHLDPGAEELPPRPGAGDGTTSPREVQAGAGNALRALYLAVVLTLFTIVVAGSIFLRSRGVKLSSLVTVWELLGYAFATAFLVLLFLYYDSIFEGIRSFFDTVGGVLGGRGGDGNVGPGLPTGTAPATALLWIAVAIVTVYLAFFAYRFLPGLQEAIAIEEPAAKGRRELARAVRTAIRDLEAGEDFRGAVLRCYKTMVLLFEQHGRRALPSQTAREFESDALRGMGVSQESIDDLTSLFEEARYSTHAIGEAQRDASIECLGTIRAQLEAAA